MEKHLKIQLSLIMLVQIITACKPILPSSDPQPITSISSPDQQSNPLPEPKFTGDYSLEETIAKRRSVRAFQDTPLTELQIGQLLWAAQGITDPAGLRAAPSAGATYPLDIYAATSDGLFLYNPEDHCLVRIFEYDSRPHLYQAALQQSWVRDAPLVIIITADYSRTSQRYGQERTPQYVHLEAGHAAQNILLQAVALGLGAVPVGAFHDDQVIDVLSLPKPTTPLYLIPVGVPVSDGQ
jgi:SagB-type dehydrogenase family enzyme